MTGLFLLSLSIKVFEYYFSFQRENSKFLNIIIDLAKARYYWTKSGARPCRESVSKFLNAKAPKVVEIC